MRRGSLLARGWQRRSFGLRRGLEVGFRGFAASAVAASIVLAAAGQWSMVAIGMTMVDAAVAVAGVAGSAFAFPRIATGSGWVRAVLLAAVFVAFAVSSKLLLGLPFPLLVRPLGLPRPDGLWLDPSYALLVGALLAAWLRASRAYRRRVG